MILYRVTGHSPSPPSVAWPTSALSGNTVQRSTPSMTLTLVISIVMLMTYNFCTVLGLKIDEIYSFEPTLAPVFYLVTKIKEIAFYKANTYYNNCKIIDFLDKEWKSKILLQDSILLKCTGYILNGSSLLILFLSNRP